jgi:hypothetical protein
MAADSTKRELDRKRTEWRKKHRTLNGRIILYPERPPEHVNARGSKVYSWFWREILLTLHAADIPAVISTLQDCIKAAHSPQEIQRYRTMIGMAEDCYQLKQLEEIDRFDPELQVNPTLQYDSEEGVVHRDGSVTTLDYNQEETAILLRDMEGILRDVLSSDEPDVRFARSPRFSHYLDWDYE